jgi:hypothetical protein
MRTSSWTPRLSLQFPLKEKLPGLRTVDQHQALRREPQQLAADLRADAAGTAGDHQHPAVDPLPDVPQIELHRFAPQ